ncbi:MAG TPA: sugar phosphate isomerase/epimerase [Acidobacteriaceae bacterium]|jgi:sugar phosphate isomerase/epimerase|nr:sugar phosphate isomerase/epimerase [Acidobacteriaceae bacterium]
MSKNSRRNFLKTGSAALLYGSAFGRGHRLAAASLGLPLGLQLYSVRELLPKDYTGTLKQIGSLGYREVEAAGFYDHSAAQVRQAMQNAGLRCVSMHYSYDDLHEQFDQILAFGKGIGVHYIICAYPGYKNPSQSQNASSKNQPPSFTLDDWRWNAEQFNRMGEKVNAAGMKFGYHNHTMEFRAQDGVVPYVELLRLTDPSKVTMEMDCGWVVVGGGNPIEYLRNYPTRISMLHIKDFKRTNKPMSITNPPPAAELGHGMIDYQPIFEEAAKHGYIKHCFVEQEGFDMPPMQALKIDADYMRNLKA